jgi:hypothetical protein
MSHLLAMDEIREPKTFYVAALLYKADARTGMEAAFVASYVLGGPSRKVVFQESPHLSFIFGRGGRSSAAGKQNDRRKKQQTGKRHAAFNNDLRDLHKQFSFAERIRFTAHF